MTRKFWIVAAGLCALGIAETAIAADMAEQPMATKATPAPAYVAAIYDWSGLYFGGNAGYGMNRNTWNLVNPATGLLTPEGTNNANGAVAGGQIGYRAQLGAWV